MAYFKVQFRHMYWELKQFAKWFSQDSHCLGQYSNPAPPE
jgi:hypothetical protein